jgi:uncharacterized LabA/DUF88 family protein
MSAPIPVTPTAAPPGHVRFRIFVDFWNLQLTLNEHVAKSTGQTDPRVKIDFLAMPNVFVAEAIKFLRPASYSLEGTIVYTSYNPKRPQDKKYRQWLTGWLDRQPGFQVMCFERRPKDAPKCPNCHMRVDVCPGCNGRMAGTIEKGVDTAIATDMIRLAWEQAYDVGILATCDADLVPAVNYLDVKGIRIVQAGFPPNGAELSRACWATIDVPSLLRQFQRP